MKNKKFLAVLTISLFVFSTAGSILGAGDDPSENIGDDTKNFEKKDYLLSLKKPGFVNKGEYVKINLEDAETYLSHSGKPMLPVVTKTFDFPIGTEINDVNVDIQWDTYNLDKKVAPTPVFIPKSKDVDPATIEEKKIDEELYSSGELYPSETFSVKYGAGLEDMEHVVFVNVKCFTQYSPANDYVKVPTKIEVTVEYSPSDPQQSGEQYDLIIITHDLFKDELQRLVTHKENKGITTKIVTVDEIYQEYESESPYDWEQIKMYLADNVLNWDTTYVLLAGGHKGQTHE